MIDYPAVRSALRARLLQVEGVTRTNVAWQNTSFTPTTGVLYMRETLLVSSEQVIASGQLGAAGLYQLDVFVPFGKKVEDGERLMKRIGDAFAPPQSVVSSSGVTVEIDRAEPLTSYEAKPWYIFPLSIRWRSYTSTPNR